MKNLHKTWIQILICGLLFTTLSSSKVDRPMPNNGYSQTLYITWAGVIDNGEGDNCPHGPWGNLYVVVYLGNNSCPYYGTEISGFDGYHSKKVMEGPSSGICRHPFAQYASDEWIDGDAMRMKLPIHNWTSSEYDEQVTIYIYESDKKMLGGVLRPTGHDLLYCYSFWKSQTINNYFMTWSNRTPGKDAVKMASKRGAYSWLKDVWDGGLNSSTPSIFVQFLTE